MSGVGWDCLELDCVENWKDPLLLPLGTQLEPPFSPDPLDPHLGILTCLMVLLSPFLPQVGTLEMVQEDLQDGVLLHQAPQWVL